MMRSVVATIVVAGGCYVAICIYYYLVQDRIVFPGAPAVAPEVSATQVEFAVPGATLAGAVVNPDAPVDVVYFGGNAEAVMHGARRFAAITRARTLLVEYRGYGNSTGKPSQAALIDDAVRYIGEFRAGRTGPLVLIGRSLGSGVAALTAARLRSKVDALVLISPFCSLVRVAAFHLPWLPVSLLMRTRFDVQAVVDALPHAVSIVIALDDDLVPASESRCVIGALTAQPTVLEVPDAGHNDVLERDAPWRLIADAVDRR
jgi:pimeloyl-ACP methyl ester carboxylesterase